LSAPDLSQLEDLQRLLPADLVPSLQRGGKYWRVLVGPGVDGRRLTGAAEENTLPKISNNVLRSRTRPAAASFTSPASR
jgi:hypothetical protein